MEIDMVVRVIALAVCIPFLLLAVAGILITVGLNLYGMWEVCAGRFRGPLPR